MSIHMKNTPLPWKNRGPQVRCIAAEANKTSVHSQIGLRHLDWFALLVLAWLLAGCSQSEASELYASTGNAVSEGATTDDAPGGDSLDSEAAEDGSTMIFYDDFEGASSIPDQSKWVLCQRGDSNWARYLSESYDQAYQQDGILYLKAEKIDGQYKTAGIETRGKFDFTYGTVTCRARFQRMPQGNHTGIWMMPAPPAEQWPKSGEIDIMEHLNKDDIIYETVHSWYSDDMGHKDDPVSQEKVSINQEDWNVYGVTWTPDRITYTVNGQAYLSYPNLHLEGSDGAMQWPFDHPFYLILSQSLGGDGTWAGPIDDSELPAVFEIDWIKVTQPTPESSGIDAVYPD